MKKKITFFQIQWKEHKNALVKGESDIASAAFKEDFRDGCWISDPYRFEVDAVTIRREDEKKHKYENVSEFIDFVKKNNLKIATISDYAYGVKELNDFVRDPNNKKHFVLTSSDQEGLNLLLAKRVDGYLGDMLASASLIWKQSKGGEVVAKDIQAKAPVHFLISRKTQNQTFVDQINAAIKEAKKSGEIELLIDSYLHQVFLMQTADSSWFRYCEFLGMLAFAISGFLIAYQYKVTLLGSMMLCLFPSLGGGLIRDITLGRFPVWFIQNAIYLGVIVFICILFFIVEKIFIYVQVRRKKYRPDSNEIDPLNEEKKHKRKKILLNNFIVIADTFGMAVFTVSGVLVSLIMIVEPLWAWGPFFGLITSTGGGFIRDLIVSKEKIDLLYGSPSAEICFLCGIILSVYLNCFSSYEYVLHTKVAAFLSITIFFIIRLIFYFFSVPNLYIRSKTNEVTQ